jgi:hypothetical protein
MGKPTEDAQWLFDTAKGPMRNMMMKADDRNFAMLATTMVNLLNGLESMAVAQRATYLKLEELERKLSALRR